MAENGFERGETGAIQENMLDSLRKQGAARTGGICKFQNPLIEHEQFCGNATVMNKFVL